jgi:hypothetical protein
VVARGRHAKFLDGAETPVTGDERLKLLDLVGALSRAQRSRRSIALTASGFGCARACCNRCKSSTALFRFSSASNSTASSVNGYKGRPAATCLKRWCARSSSWSTNLNYRARQMFSMKAVMSGAIEPLTHAARLF